jgi:(p)ppGpp synthase/HD superfamily hydrolase
MIEFPDLTSEIADNGRARSPIVREAHRVAAARHEGQSRKADRRPYLDHVVAVAEILADAGFDDEVVAAALLHDAVEHTDVRGEEIASRFGDRIAGMVSAMTDRAEIEPWEERKAEHRERIRAAGRDAAAIYGADKLVGIRETREGYAEAEENVEERLGNPLDVRVRVWEADLEMLEQVTPPLTFVEEIRDELGRLRGDRSTARPRT